MDDIIKILFVRPFKSTFIQTDLELLQRHFDVKVVDFTYSNPINFMKTVFNIMLGVFWADVTFSWFAGSHAFLTVKLAKLLRKKSIVIVGGYEVANIPNINYGLLSRKLSAKMVKNFLNDVDLILPVDKGLKLNLTELGIENNIIQVLPTGYDFKEYKNHNDIKENLVITVSVGNTWDRVKLKGLDTFVRSAKFLPEVEYILIGITDEALIRLREIATPNVKFIEPLPQKKLISYYRKAKCYCQLSMREGLPNALCEAMLCECVPVGTEVQGVTTAMGSTGFYVSYGDIEGTSKAIHKALKSDKGKFARERIIKKFPLSQREKELRNILKNFK